jgi:multidrug resistance efflux pump
MEKKEDYQRKMETQLSEWGAEIDKLTAKVEGTAADTRQGYYDQIEAFQAKKALMQAKLQELKTSSDGAWGDLKEGLDQSWNQARDSFINATARFKPKP